MIIPGKSPSHVEYNYFYVKELTETPMYIVVLYWGGGGG